jgi:hypothetical protein
LSNAAKQEQRPQAKDALVQTEACAVSEDESESTFVQT